MLVCRMDGPLSQQRLPRPLSSGHRRELGACVSRAPRRLQEALRRERDGLAARLRAAELAGERLGEERRELAATLARERHAATAAAADLQRQLKSARDRLEAMVRCAGVGIFGVEL